jgi:tetratricopeptide (TPR) repeat protein
MTRLSRSAAAALLALLPGAAFAVGSETTPPPATETSGRCEKGQIWDRETRKCLDAKSGVFDNDARYAALRELAYAGRIDAAQTVLDAMTEGETDRVLTYRGFLARKAGRFDEGMAFYAQALAQNPDNLLARSYRGMGLAERGLLAEARAELDQIRARGGAGSWPETALAQVIRDGRSSLY